MLGIGSTELVIIIVFAFLIFGPERLPQIGLALGRAIKEFKKAYSQFSSEVNEDFGEEVLPSVDDIARNGSASNPIVAGMLGLDENRGWSRVEPHGEPPMPEEPSPEPEPNPSFSQEERELTAEESEEAETNPYNRRPGREERIAGARKRREAMEQEQNMHGAVGIGIPILEGEEARWPDVEPPHEDILPWMRDDDDDSAPRGFGRLFRKK